MNPLLAEVRVGELNDANEMAVHRLVSAFPPFHNYSYQLMLGKIREQLMFKTHVMLWDQGQLVGYAGWSLAEASVAQAWYQGEQTEFPAPKMQNADAAIVTIVVVRTPEYLPLAIKAISHQCAGLQVYRLRSFQDGRPDMRRPPILGRTQHIFSYQRAYAQLSGLLNDLYLRASGKAGRLNFPIPIMIDPSRIQTVLRQPERFIKNYQFLERLAEGRFTTNNDAWQKRSRLTQVFYNNATRQVPLNRLKTLYQSFLPSSTAGKSAVFNGALQAAVCAVSEAFGLDEPIYWPLDKVEALRNELMLLQAIELFGGSAQELETAQRNMDSLRHQIVQHWQQNPALAKWLSALTSEFSAELELVQNMMAATETTAATVEWMARLLAAQPALLAELKQSGVSDEAGELTLLAQQFILEVLRLYPPVPFITRVCQFAKSQDDDFQANQAVAISLVGLHTHPQFWQQPMRFWPQRPEWAASEEGKINLQHPAYLPFLTGPRVCGGRKLAMLELQAALDVLVNHCEIRPTSEMPKVSYGMVSRPA